MKFSFRVAAPVAAAFIAAGALTGTGQAVAGIPAAEEAGTTPQATIQDTPPEKRKEPGWVKEQEVHKHANRMIKWAYSPSMKRWVPLFIIAPKDNSVPRPILYVLNGGDGGEGSATWLQQTDLVHFYDKKNIWTVMPMEGAFSYYSDWVNDAPSLGGKQNWETFLTKELPEVLEHELGASPKRAIIGLSMSATTTLLYAEHHPGFYDAVGSFSGCAETSRGFALEYLRITLNRGGATPEQMWGPIGGKTFLYNDALLNAERLRGTKHIYIASGSGLAGPYDLWNSTFTGADSSAVAVHVVNGGIIEAAVNKCTHDLKARLDQQGITNIDWNFRPYGTHSWGYWQDDLRKSWPTIARAFDMDPDANVAQSEPGPVPLTNRDISDLLDAARGIDPRTGHTAQKKPARTTKPEHNPIAREDTKQKQQTPADADKRLRIVPQPGAGNLTTNHPLAVPPVPRS